MLAFGPNKNFVRHSNSKKQRDLSMMSGSTGLMDPVLNTANISASSTSSASSASSSNNNSANNSISSPEYTFGQFSMDSPHRTDVTNTPILTATTDTTANNSLMSLKDTANSGWKWKNSGNMQFLNQIENESGNDNCKKNSDERVFTSIATPQALNDELRNLEQLEKVFSPMNSTKDIQFNENLELSPHQHITSPGTNPLEAEPSIYSNLFLDAKFPNNASSSTGLNDNCYNLDDTNDNNDSNDSNNNNNSMQSILEDFVSSEEALKFMPDTGCDTRRYSEVVTSSFPSMTDSRNSISHSIEFWNLNHKNGNNGKPTQQMIPEASTASERRGSTISPTTTLNSSNANFKLLDHNVSQVLNGYSLDFSKDSGITKPRNTSSSSNRVSHSSGNTRQQRASLPLIHDIESFANDSVMANPLSDSASFFSEENEDDAFGTLNYNSLGGAAATAFDNNIEPFNVLKPPPTQDQQFIKPSMMLSDNASAAAKLATSGVDNVTPAPAFQRKSYDISMNPSFKLLPTNLVHHATQHHHHQQPAKQASVSPSTRRRKSSSITLSPTISHNSNTGKVPVQPRKRTSITTIDPNNYDKNKPFKCNDCEKAFRRSEHLKRHIRSVHSTERPFACMFCEKKFSRSDNLSQHLKTHRKHGDF
ncbi:msn4p [Saccharomyces arboricola H-6]|uniref:Msn4p n=1 Tax=Saccharomyces arboricola (strain H-6 / AS 2.3317 / CBS 10644) TaxID=1160507 RepID=J8LLC8_SACAR|nr:msn4p [Saccharomyces arboricola H-6]